MLLVPITVAVITITIMLMMITVSKAGPRKATYKAMIMVIDPIMMLDRPLGVRTTITMMIPTGSCDILRTRNNHQHLSCGFGCRPIGNKHNSP